MTNIKVAVAVKGVNNTVLQSHIEVSYSIFQHYYIGLHISARTVSNMYRGRFAALGSSSYFTNNLLQLIANFSIVLRFK